MSFPNTQWSLLAIASMNGDKAGRTALEKLCESYRSPVLNYYRELLPSYQDAEDLTQNLLMQLTLASTWKKADPYRGKFRDYLRKIALNALRNWKAYLKAGKRWNGVAPESLDFLLEEESAPAATDGRDSRAFDRKWADAILTEAMERSERFFIQNFGMEQYNVLKRFLPGSNRAPTAAEAAQLLGISEAGVRTHVYRMRQGIKNALRDIIRPTLGKDDDLEEEIAYLLSVLEMPLPDVPGEKER